MNYRAWFLLLSMSWIAVGQSGEFWQTKEYRQWSEKECRKLLENSPWAQTYTLKEVFIDPINAVPATTSDRPAGREALPAFEYKVQFRSALPLRQALVRAEQLNPRYAQLSGEQQQQVEARAAEFLDKKFPDSVVVHVSHSSNVHDDAQVIMRHWRSQTTQTLKNFVYLIVRGEKIPLLSYAVVDATGQAFQFTFPRLVNGQPLITATDKSVQLEFQHPGLRGRPQTRVLIEFKVKRMQVQDDVIY